MAKILGADFGKSYVKLAILSVSEAGEAVEITGLTVKSFKVSDVPRDTVGNLAQWLFARCHKVPDKQLDRIALTVPLPLQGQVYDSSPTRKGWEVFMGKTPDAVERLLSDEARKVFGRPIPVRIMHDAESQVCFVSKEFKPEGFYGVAAFGTSIAFAIAHEREGGFTIAQPSSTFSHAVLAEGSGPACESCGRSCIGAAYKKEREGTEASAGVAERKVEVHAVCQAVSVLCTLPLKTLYVTGGYLENPEVEAAIKGMKAKMKYSSAGIEVVPVNSARFSGAIGAAYLLARTTRP